MVLEEPRLATPFLPTLWLLCSYFVHITRLLMLCSLWNGEHILEQIFSINILPVNALTHCILDLRPSRTNCLLQGI